MDVARQIRLLGPRSIVDQQDQTGETGAVPTGW
jgi:hypothetical protein